MEETLQGDSEREQGERGIGGAFDCELSECGTNSKTGGGVGVPPPPGAPTTAWFVIIVGERRAEGVEDVG